MIYFEEFVKEAEHSWEPIKKDMYEKLLNIYQIIVNEIFKGVESIASESQKTPPDVIRFQNYHQMLRKFNKFESYFLNCIKILNTLRHHEKYKWL